MFLVKIQGEEAVTIKVENKVGEGREGSFLGSA
jgi:hypothetical protein